MIQRFSHGLAVLAFVVISSTDALAFPIDIDPGAYPGYRVDGGAFITGGSTLNLETGVHSIKNGGESGFLFDVDASGQVTSRNTVAATGSGNTLTFNTTSIIIDPGLYPVYSMTGFGATLFTGVQTFNVIPTLRYGCGNGAFVGGAGFLFTVDASGQVTSLNPVAATGSGNTLTFNTTSIIIDPGLYPAYAMTGFGSTLFTGVQTFNVIPTLRYGCGNGGFIGGAGFVFAVDASGQVTSENPVAAIGSGNTLTLANVVIHVDPTTYTGLYNVYSHVGLSGPVDIALIPSTVTRVDAGSAGGQVIPDFGQVTPPSLILTIGGQPHTFLFSSNQDPIADAGPDQTLECTSPDGALVILNGAGSDPDGDPVECRWDVPAGISLDDPTSFTPSGVFPIGITMATLTVTDGRGGVDTDDVVITVEDTTGPETSCTTDVAMLWPPNHNMVEVNVFVNATDACTNPDDLVLLLADVSSNEPDNATGLGDGDTTGDTDGSDGFTGPVDITGKLSYNPVTASFEGSIQLRAERDGDGTGRAYTIEAWAIDTQGNIGYASCVVVVPHSKKTK